MGAGRAVQGETQLKGGLVEWPGDIGRNVITLLILRRISYNECHKFAICVIVSCPDHTIS